MTCPHFGVCGGCSIQNLPYEDQLKKKERLVQDALIDIPVENWSPILPSPEIQYYRNKMEFSFGDERDVAILKKEPVGSSGQVHLGLHPKGRFNLVTPTPECRLISLEAQKIIEIISEWATQQQISSYLRHKNQGILRHVVIREGKNTAERMVNLVSTSQLSEIEILSDALRNSGVPITTFLWTVHDGLSDVARGPQTKIIWGEGFIKERVRTVSFRVAPFSFMQTNTHASEKMIDLLKSWLSSPSPTTPKEESVLFDLYCGAGTIALNLADQFEKVMGIESEPSAVSSARETARFNNIHHAEFVEGRVDKYQ